MGHESVVYGCIVGAGWKIHDRDRLHRMNATVIRSLPPDDEWPFLTRAMFTCAEGGGVSQGVYKSLPLHFGATLKAVEWEWEEWLTKFERLLGQLFWTEAFLHLRTEATVGHHDYTYAAVDSKRLYEDPPAPPSVWTLKGGPRTFDSSSAGHTPESWIFQDGVLRPAAVSK